MTIGIISTPFRTEKDFFSYENEIDIIYPKESKHIVNEGDYLVYWKLNSGIETFNIYSKKLAKEYYDSINASGVLDKRLLKISRITFE